MEPPVKGDCLLYSPITIKNEHTNDAVHASAIARVQVKHFGVIFHSRFTAVV